MTTTRPSRRGGALAAVATLLAVLLALLVTTVLAGGATQAAGRDVRSLPRPQVAPAVAVRPTAALPSLTGLQVREERTAQLQAKLQLLMRTVEGRTVTDQADPRLDPASCGLLGRVWTDAGCSRAACLVGHEYAKSGANAETCRIGGREGASYGVEVDFRRCDALHRVWIGLLNYCASDPHRDQTTVSDAPPCRAPWTTFVLLTDVPGGYDECLRPERAAQLAAVAQAQGRTLGELVLERSRTQCAWRAHVVWSDGECVPGETTPRVPGNVLVVGDSITWRGTDELATLEPDWVIDGSSGRQVDALAERLQDYRDAYGEPGGVIFALGTNGRSGWTEEEFRASVATLPATTPVLFVTPFREPGGAGRPQLSDLYADWMHRLATDRPATCLADWRQAVSTDDALLVDGVHPTSLGEVFWAEMVDGGWRDCLAAQGRATP